MNILKFIIGLTFRVINVIWLSISFLLFGIISIYVLPAILIALILYGVYNLISLIINWTKFPINKNNKPEDTINELVEEDTIEISTDK